MKIVFAGLINFALLSSCASLSQKPDSGFTKLKNVPAHISTHCKILDLNGNFLRKIPGRACIFNSDGSVILANRNTIAYYDNKLQPKWTKSFNFLHHTFLKSEFAEEMLVLESEYENFNDNRIRSEVLLVLDMNGNVLKSLKFDTLLKQIEASPKEPAEAQWADVDSGIEKGSLERTHVNSFYEFYEIKGGKKVHAGYIVHCNAMKIIIVLDKELKKARQVISTNMRDIHDVQQRNERQLFFYQNSNREDAIWPHSQISGYDLDSRRFFEIYRPDKALSSAACSSVQEFDVNRLLITHSHCDHRLKTTVPVLEYVDLRTNESTTMPVPYFYNMTSARLQNLTEFLKNSSGL